MEERRRAKRHLTGFLRDHARLVDRASPGTTISGKRYREQWSHMGRGTSSDDWQKRMEKLDCPMCTRDGLRSKVRYHSGRKCYKCLILHVCDSICVISVWMCYITDCAGEQCCAFTRCSYHCIQHCFDTSGPAAQQRLALHCARWRSQDPQSRCSDNSRLQTGQLISTCYFVSAYLIRHVQLAKLKAVPYLLQALSS